MGWIRDPGKTYSRGQKSPGSATLVVPWLSLFLSVTLWLSRTVVFYVSVESFMINAKALKFVILYKFNIFAEELVYNFESRQGPS